MLPSTGVCNNSFSLCLRLVLNIGFRLCYSDSVLQKQIDLNSTDMEIFKLLQNLDIEIDQLL